MTPEQLIELAGKEKPGPDHNGDYECVCGRGYRLRYDCDDTGWCDICAQNIASVTAPDLARRLVRIREILADLPRAIDCSDAFTTVDCALAIYLRKSKARELLALLEAGK